MERAELHAEGGQKSEVDDSRRQTRDLRRSRRHQTRSGRPLLDSVPCSCSLRSF